MSQASLIAVLLRAVVLMLGLAALPAAMAAEDDEAMLLVAHPQFRDLDYRQTVLLAAPAPNGGHVGVILNRPTRRSLSSLFPEHEPSKKVVDPVHYGGPFSRGALVALIRGESTPGTGAVPLMKNLYLAFRANTIDSIIESKPNEARYYVGYVGWRPGELRGEIDRGLWSVLGADPEVAFRKDMDGLWEEMIQQTKRIRAENQNLDPRFRGGDVLALLKAKPYAAAFAGDFSNTIRPLR